LAVLLEISEAEPESIMYPSGFVFISFSNIGASFLNIGAYLCDASY